MTAPFACPANCHLVYAALHEQPQQQSDVTIADAVQPRSREPDFHRSRVPPCSHGAGRGGGGGKLAPNRRACFVLQTSGRGGGAVVVL